MHRHSNRSSNRYLPKQRSSVIFSLALVVVCICSANILAAGKLHISEKDITKIVQEVSNVMGVQLKEVPKVEVVSYEVYYQEFNYEVKEMFKQFPTENLNNIVARFQETVAFYSWYSGKIYFLEGYADTLAQTVGISASSAEKICLVRELTRAIDHQNYDFPYYLRKALNTESLQLLQMITQARGYQVLDKIYTKLSIGNAEYKKYFTNKNPEFDQRYLSYEKIMAFLTYIAEKGVTVEELYNNPPLDGLLVLFPEKYLAGVKTERSVMEDIFTKEDFTLKLPWNFKYASCKRADHLSLYEDLVGLQQNESYLRDYIDGIYCYYSEKQPNRPKNQYAIYRNSVKDYSKGMFSVNLYKFATAEGAKGLMDFFANYYQGVMEKTSHEDLDFSIEKIKKRFPENFLGTSRKEGSSDQMYYLLFTVDAVNVIEMNIINMDPTEEQLIQVIDLVLARMDAMQSQGATPEKQ